MPGKRKKPSRTSKPKVKIKRAKRNPSNEENVEERRVDTRRLPKTQKEAGDNKKAKTKKQPRLKTNLDPQSAPIFTRSMTRHYRESMQQSSPTSRENWHLYSETETHREGLADIDDHPRPPDVHSETTSEVMFDTPSRTQNLSQKTQEDNVREKQTASDDADECADTSQSLHENKNAVSRSLGTKDRKQPLLQKDPFLWWKCCYSSLFRSGSQGKFCREGIVTPAPKPPHVDKACQVPSDLGIYQIDVATCTRHYGSEANVQPDGPYADTETLSMNNNEVLADSREKMDTEDEVLHVQASEIQQDRENSEIRPVDYPHHSEVDDRMNSLNGAPEKTIQSTKQHWDIREIIKSIEKEHADAHQLKFEDRPLEEPRGEIAQRTDYYSSDTSIHHQPVYFTVGSVPGQKTTPILMGDDKTESQHQKDLELTLKHLRDVLYNKNIPALELNKFRKAHPESNSDTE